MFIYVIRTCRISHYSSHYSLCQGVQKGVCLESVVLARYTISIVISNKYLARAELGLENIRAQEDSAVSQSILTTEG